MSSVIELNAAWAGLRGATVPWGAHLLESLEGYKQFCAVNDKMEIAFLVESYQRPPQFSDFDAVKVTILEIVAGVKWQTIFELQDRAYEMEFAELCADLTSAVSGASAAVQAQTLTHQAYEAWVSFFRKTNSFSLEMARGLYAELVFIRDTVCARYTWDQVLNSWQGPLKGAHDFVFPGNVAVEVKSIQPSGHEVVISSENQLTYVGELHLRVYRLLDHLTAAMGQSVEQIVAEIQEMLSLPQGKLFRELLKSAGYDPKSKNATLRFFEVTQIMNLNASSLDFPKVESHSLPLGVSNVRYALDISHLFHFETSF